jgi:hypothetical protein
MHVKTEGPVFPPPSAHLLQSVVTAGVQVVVAGRSGLLPDCARAGSRRPARLAEPPEVLVDIGERAMDCPARRRVGGVGVGEGVSIGPSPNVLETQGGDSSAGSSSCRDLAGHGRNGHQANCPLVRHAFAGATYHGR